MHSSELWSYYSSTGVKDSFVLFLLFNASNVTAFVYTRRYEKEGIPAIAKGFQREGRSFKLEEEEIQLEGGGFNCSEAENVLPSTFCFDTVSTRGRHYIYCFAWF